MLNLVKAGSLGAREVSLGGDRGIGVFAVGSPSSQRITCDVKRRWMSSRNVSPRGSTLSYDGLADRYQYVWKTDAAWSDTCRRLAVEHRRRRHALCELQAQVGVRERKRHDSPQRATHEVGG
jgi:hypothetical protein